LLAPVATTGARLTRQRVEAAQANAGVLQGQIKTNKAAERLAKDALR